MLFLSAANEAHLPFLFTMIGALVLAILVPNIGFDVSRDAVKKDHQGTKKRHIWYSVTGVLPFLAATTPTDSCRMLWSCSVLGRPVHTA